MFLNLAFLTINPPPKLRLLYEKNNRMEIGLYSILIGDIAVFFLNDSGVVASATLLFYPIMVLVYLQNAYN